MKNAQIRGPTCQPYSKNCGFQSIMETTSSDLQPINFLYLTPMKYEENDGFLVFNQMMKTALLSPTFLLFTPAQMVASPMGGQFGPSLDTSYFTVYLNESSLHHLHGTAPHDISWSVMGVFTF